MASPRLPAFSPQGQPASRLEDCHPLSSTAIDYLYALSSPRYRLANSLPSSVDSTETPYRYAGYANRLRTILLSAHRYVAYTSDIGESFRPVAHPWLVRSAYGISWTYLIGDVAHEGYKAYLRNRRVLAPPCEAYKDASDLTHDKIAKGMVTGNISGSLTGGDTLMPWPTTQVPLAEDYRMVMAQRAVFQSIASMGLPAFTIHSVVKYSGRMLKNSRSVFFRTWTPIGVSSVSSNSVNVDANMH